MPTEFWNTFGMFMHCSGTKHILFTLIKHVKVLFAASYLVTKTHIGRGSQQGLPSQTHGETMTRVCLGYYRGITACRQGEKDGQMEDERTGDHSSAQRQLDSGHLICTRLLFNGATNEAQTGRQFLIWVSNCNQFKYFSHQQIRITASCLLYKVCGPSILRPPTGPWEYGLMCYRLS